MAAPHMTSKIRKALKEYIENIPTDNLEQFVNFPDTQPGNLKANYDFGSQDFHLAFLGVSSILQPPEPPLSRRYFRTHTLLPR